MANEMHTSVPKITITAGRIDAVVILGSTRYGVVLDPRHPDGEPVQMAVETLRDAILEHAKIEIADELDTLLAPSVKAALKR